MKNLLISKNSKTDFLVFFFSILFYATSKRLFFFPFSLNIKKFATFFPLNSSLLSLWVTLFEISRRTRPDEGVKKLRLSQLLESTLPTTTTTTKTTLSTLYRRFSLKRNAAMNKIESFLSIKTKKKNFSQINKIDLFEKISQLFLFILGINDRFCCHRE